MKQSALCRKLHRVAMDRLLAVHEKKVSYGALVANGKTTLSHFAMAPIDLSEEKSTDVVRGLTDKATDGHPNICVLCGDEKDAVAAVLHCYALRVGLAAVRCEQHGDQVQAMISDIDSHMQMIAAESSPEEDLYRAMVSDPDISKGIVLAIKLDGTVKDRRIKSDTICPLVVASGPKQVFRDDSDMRRGVPGLPDLVMRIALKQLQKKHKLECIICGKCKGEMAVSVQYFEVFHAHYGVSTCAAHAAKGHTVTNRVKGCIAAAAAAVEMASSGTASSPAAIPDPSVMADCVRKMLARQKP